MLVPCGNCGSESSRGGTALLFLRGLLGVFFREVSLPQFAFLLMLALLIVNSLNEGVHQVVEGAAWREGATLEQIGVRVDLKLRCDAGEDHTFLIIDGEEVIRVGRAPAGLSGGDRTQGWALGGLVLSPGACQGWHRRGGAGLGDGGNDEGDERQDY